MKRFSFPTKFYKVLKIMFIDKNIYIGNNRKGKEIKGRFIRFI